jgi:hypothetical protein
MNDTFRTRYFTNLRYGITHPIVVFPCSCYVSRVSPRDDPTVIIVLLKACHFHITGLLEGIRPTLFAVKRVYTPLLPVRSCPIP